MKIIQGYLEKFGQNFLVASMLPSLAFFAVSMVVFQPIIPDSLLDLLGGSFNMLEISGLLLLISTILLGFTLTALNTYIYKVFEGYSIIRRIPHLKQREIKRAHSYKRKLKFIERKIQRLKRRKNPSAIKKRNSLIQQKQSLITEYDLYFPYSYEEIMPTRFGNIIKAAECYPQERYSIDAVPMWPRLIHAIPNEYLSKVDQIHNQLSFLMNCTVLTLMFSVSNLLAGIYQIMLYCRVSNGNRIRPLYFIEVNDQINEYWQRAIIYGILCMVAFLVTLVYQRAAKFIVIEYSWLIRSSYDLFRFDLLKLFRLNLPKNHEEEKGIWEDLCDFINLGSRYVPFKHKYVHPPDESHVPS